MPPFSLFQTGQQQSTPGAEPAEPVFWIREGRAGTDTDRPTGCSQWLERWTELELLQLEREPAPPRPDSYVVLAIPAHGVARLLGLLDRFSASLGRVLGLDGPAWPCISVLGRASRWPAGRRPSRAAPPRPARGGSEDADGPTKSFWVQVSCGQVP